MLANVAHFQTPDPECPIPSIESPTSQNRSSIVSTDGKDSASRAIASPQASPYTSRHWLVGRVSHPLDSILQWDCIVFCLIDGESFKSDLQTGSTAYCSHALIDALTALSVAVFRHDATEEVSAQRTEAPARNVLSGALVDEVVQALHRGAWTPDSVPDIQALGVLALYCLCSHWRDQSYNFAMEFAEAIRTHCLKDPDPDSDVTLRTTCRVTASTYCGAISMNR